MVNKLKQEIYQEVIEGYFTNENFMKEGKSDAVKRTIDLTLNKIRELIDKVPDVDYVGEYLLKEFIK